VPPAYEILRRGWEERTLINLPQPFLHPQTHPRECIRLLQYIINSSTLILVFQTIPVFSSSFFTKYLLNGGKLNTNPSKTQTGGSKLLGINVIIKPLTNPLRRL